MTLYNYIYFTVLYSDMYWRIGKFNYSISKYKFKLNDQFDLTIVFCDEGSKRIDTIIWNKKYVLRKPYIDNIKLYTTLEEAISDHFTEIL